MVCHGMPWYTSQRIPHVPWRPEADFWGLWGAEPPSIRGVWGQSPPDEHWNWVLHRVIGFCCSDWRIQGRSQEFGARCQGLGVRLPGLAHWYSDGSSRRYWSLGLRLYRDSGLACTISVSGFISSVFGYTNSEDQCQLTLVQHCVSLLPK